MTDYMRKKLELQKELMFAIEQGVDVNKEKLLAEASLKTGFAERTIMKTLIQLEVMGHITIIGDVVRAVKQEKKKRK